jgi:hypothetical protein
MSEGSKQAEFWREAFRDAAVNATVSQAEANELRRMLMEFAQRLPDFDRGVILSQVEDRLAAAREKAALDARDKGVKFPLPPADTSP